MRDYYDWTEDRISKLRALWAVGLTTAQIARVLNTSKNSVIGKAHRLELQGRPSPIVKAGTPSKRAYVRRSQSKRVVRATMQAVPTTSKPKVTRMNVEPFVPPPAPPPRVVVLRPNSECCWPFGDPRNRTEFRYCDAPCRGSYCPEHRKLAYVKKAA